MEPEINAIIQSRLKKLEILNEKGKVKAIGKNIKQSDASKDAEIIDVKENGHFKIHHYFEFNAEL